MQGDKVVGAGIATLEDQQVLPSHRAAHRQEQHFRAHALQRGQSILQNTCTCICTAQTGGGRKVVVGGGGRHCTDTSAV
jgi:hypothetical protein